MVRRRRESAISGERVTLGGRVMDYRTAFHYLHGLITQTSQIIEHDVKVCNVRLNADFSVKNIAAPVTGWSVVFNNMTDQCDTSGIGASGEVLLTANTTSDEFLCFYHLYAEESATFIQDTLISRMQYKIGAGSWLELTGSRTANHSFHDATHKYGSQGAMAFTQVLSSYTAGVSYRINVQKLTADPPNVMNLKQYRCTMTFVKTGLYQFTP